MQQFYPSSLAYGSTTPCSPALLSPVETPGPHRPLSDRATRPAQSCLGIFTQLSLSWSPP